MKKKTLIILFLSILIVVISSVCCFADTYYGFLASCEFDDYYIQFRDETADDSFFFTRKSFDYIFGSNLVEGHVYSFLLYTYPDNLYRKFYFSGLPLSTSIGSPTPLVLNPYDGTYDSRNIFNVSSETTTSSLKKFYFTLSTIQVLDIPVISLTSNYGISIPIEENATGFEIQKLDSREDWVDYAQELYSAPGGHSVFELTEFGTYRVRYITDKSGYTDSEWSDSLSFSGVQLSKPFIRIVGNQISPDPFDESAAYYQVGYSSDNTNWTYESVSSFPFIMNRVGYYKFRAVASGFPFISSDYSNTVSYIPSSDNQLETPTLSTVDYNDYILEWNRVSNASAYMIYINGVQLKQQTSTVFQVSRNGVYQVQALGNDEYSNSDLSNEVEITDFGSAVVPDRPQPPSGDDTGVIDWIRYAVDQIDYFFDTILYGIQTVIGGAVQSISTFVTYIGEFVSSVGNLFSFLPEEIVALITSCIFIVALVGILRVFL